MHPCNCRISEFSRAACPWNPLEGKAQRVLQTDARLSNPDALLLQILMKPLGISEKFENFFSEISVSFNFAVAFTHFGNSTVFEISGKFLKPFGPGQEFLECLIE